MSKTSYRYVQVPKPVQFMGLEIGLLQIVTHVCDTDARFTRTAAGGRAAMRILSDLETLEGATWKVHPTDHEILKAVLEEPEKGYLTLTRRAADGSVLEEYAMPARLALPIVDAIVDAPTTPPAIEAVEPKEDADAA